ncbi:hypothetical protein Aduo_010593 [Ancylostoma duodenale]
MKRTRSDGVVTNEQPVAKKYEPEPFKPMARPHHQKSDEDAADEDAVERQLGPHLESSIHEVDIAIEEQGEVPAGENVMEEIEERRISLNRKLTYLGAFVMHFGVSKSMQGYIDDLADVLCGERQQVTLSRSLDSFTSEVLRKYEFRKALFCNGCDELVLHRLHMCTNVLCPLQGVNPKRTKSLRRSSIHSLRLKPQLEIILKNNIETLVTVHRSVHSGNVKDLMEDTADFPQYREDVETSAEFASNVIKIVLTLNFDGVKLKKLLRCDAYPVYLRFEGLPFKQKSRPENSILAAVLFSARPPSEKILHELFSRLAEELDVLRSEGIVVRSPLVGEWKCFPHLLNAVIDFAALKHLYNSPTWQSKNGCHLCTVPGERNGRSRTWFVRFPSTKERRSNASILHDADSHQNGLQGRTQMMRLLTMERCHPDALHLLSAGVTVDLIREMFFPNNKVPELKIARAAAASLHSAIDATMSLTYGSRSILGIEEMSKMTASEKDELMFILFPLVAAQRSCADPVGCVCILVYWLLVRIIADGEINSNLFRGVRNVARTLKNFWYEISPKLFTLKLHVFLDHAIMQDMEHCGTPYHWTSSGFESLHRSLQMRIPQCTTNCEELVIKNFVLRKELYNLLQEEADTSPHPAFERLRDKIFLGEANRFPIECDLGNHWMLPRNSTVEFDELLPEHQEMLRVFSANCTFSSRMMHKSKLYVSRTYWSRGANSRQDCVMLSVDPDQDCVFGSVLIFAINHETSDSHVLLEEFHTQDPFRLLAASLETSNSPAKARAINTLSLVRNANQLFMEIVGRRLHVYPTEFITSSAVTVMLDGRSYVSRA